MRGAVPGQHPDPPVAGVYGGDGSGVRPNRGTGVGRGAPAAGTAAIAGAGFRALARFCP